MNRKGFTLIELLAVIVILLAISMTAVFGISASLGRREEKEVNEQIKLAKNAAKIYFSLLDKTDIRECVNVNNKNGNIDSLKELGYLDDKKIDKILNGSIDKIGNFYKNNNCKN